MLKKNVKTAAEEAAEREGLINPMNILEEILPLMNEYFIGKFEIGGGALKMDFLNGCRIRLVACEVS